MSADLPDPATAKSTPELCDWLAERDRECRERYGVPLFTARTGPLPVFADFLGHAGSGEPMSDGGRVRAAFHEQARRDIADAGRTRLGRFLEWVGVAIRRRGARAAAQRASRR